MFIRSNGILRLGAKSADVSQTSIKSGSMVSRSFSLLSKITSTLQRQWKAASVMGAALVTVGTGAVLNSSVALADGAPLIPQIPDASSAVGAVAGTYDVC
jgi:hypothetical protein